MRELVAANHNCDQAGDLRNRARKHCLESGKSGIEWRLPKGERRENDQQGDEAKAWAKPAQATPEDSLEPVPGYERIDHRHLLRL